MRAAGYEVIVLAGSFQPSAGVPTVDNSQSWFTVSNTGVGTYTIQLKDRFFQVYSAHIDVSSFGGVADYIAFFQPATGVSLDSLVANTGALPIKIYTKAGVAADPAADASNTVYFTLVLKNSTVTG